MILRKTTAMKRSLFLAFFCIGFAAAAADNSKALPDAAKKPVQAAACRAGKAQCAAKPADRLHAIQKAARQLIRARKKAEAKKMLLAFAEDRSNPAINRTMAYLDCVRTTDDGGEKLRFLDAGIALNSGSWPEAACHNEKGKLLLARKKYPEAVAEFKLVAGQVSYPVPSRAAACMGLASAAVQQKDYAGAHRYYGCIREFSRENPKFVSLDAMKGEAALFYLERKYEEGNSISLAIAGNPKFSAREREKALGELIETEYNRRNDPAAARTMLKKTEPLKLKHSSRVRKITKDIRYLFDEEN